MPDIGSLIESAQARGLKLFLAEGKVKVQAPQALDGDAKALLEELREHREEVKSFLNEEDLILAPEHWFGLIIEADIAAGYRYVKALASVPDPVHDL